MGTENRVSIKYDLPLAEVITDFFDVMKSRSKGYASMEYAVIDYRENDLVRRLFADLCHPQGRARQVLRRRHIAQEEAAQQAGQGQEAHEGHRLGQRAAGGFHGSA